MCCWSARFCLRDVDALLKGAQLDVVARHLGRQRHQDVPARLHGGQQVGIGGLDVAPDAAEDVQLPAGIEAGIVRIGDQPPGDAILPVGGSARRAAALDGARGVDRGPEAACGDASCRARLADAGFGLHQVQVGAHGPVFEGRQNRIVEDRPPPCQVDVGRRGHGGRFRPGPVRRDVRLRGLIVRADHAAAQHRQADAGRQQPAIAVKQFANP